MLNATAQNRDAIQQSGC